MITDIMVLEKLFCIENYLSMDKFHLFFLTILLPKLLFGNNIKIVFDIGNRNYFCLRSKIMKLRSSKNAHLSPLTTNLLCILVKKLWIEFLNAISFHMSSISSPPRLLGLWSLAFWKKWLKQSVFCHWLRRHTINYNILPVHLKRFFRMLHIRCRQRSHLVRQCKAIIQSVNVTAPGRPRSITHLALYH